ncbi:MAG: PKD domain-containing protein [Bacteroidota bacterium]
MRTLIKSKLLNAKDLRRLYTLIVLTFFGPMALVSAQCYFTVSDNNPCGQVPVDFTVLGAIDSVLYQWDFDGGEFDAEGDTITYAFPGSIAGASYMVTLYADSVACATQTIVVESAPDASIGDIGGDFVICSNVQQDATLEVFNASLTFLDNVLYTIDWGDGSAPEVFDNSTFSPNTPISHVYTAFGFYDISVEVVGNGSMTCNVSTAVYTFYYGSNPAVGLNTNGNTVGLCVPATIDFPITNASLNSEGTTYEMFVNGELVETYAHPPPSNFTFDFLETSCGVTTTSGLYNNAFDVRIQATNPCASTSAIIEPIELSSPPIADFDISANSCPGEEITISSTSGNINEVMNGDCSGTAPTFWTITPAGGWTLVSGSLFNSEVIGVVFDSVGVYTIELIIQSDACPPDTAVIDFEIFEPPGAEAAIVDISSSTDNCIPGLLTFDNTSTGHEVGYNWTVSPTDGWMFVDSIYADSLNPEIQFTEPGSYDISLAVSNFCGVDTWDTTVVFLDVPEVVLQPFTSACETGTLDFDASMVSFVDNGSPITLYEWSFPGSSLPTSNDQYPTGVFYDSPGSYNISVTVTNACGSATTTGTFVVNSPGGLTLQSDFNTCIGANPTTISANPSGGMWAGPGIDSLTGVFEPDSAGIGTHTVVYTFGFGACFVQDSLDIEVNDFPVINLPDNLLCIDDPSINLNDGVSVPGFWVSSSNGLNGSNFSPGLAGIGVHQVIFTDSSTNCLNDALVEVVGPPIVDAGPTISYCDNDTEIPLADGTPAGGTWSGQGVDTANGTFNPQTAGGVGTYTLSYFYTDPLTQCFAADNVQVTVTSNIPADAGDPESICSNNAPFLPSSNTSGGDWSGPGIDSIGLFDPSLVGPGTYTILLTQGVGICLTTDSKDITVVPAPAVTFSDPQLCVNEPEIDLNVGTSSPGSWTTLSQGLNGSFFNPNLAGVGLHEFIFTDSLTNCSISAFLEVLPIPMVEAGNDTSFCINNLETPLPQATPQGGSWSGPGVNSVNATFNAETAGGPGVYVLYYNVIDGFTFCENADSITITVTSTIPVDVGPDEAVCISDAPFAPFTFTSSGTWSGSGIDTSGLFNPQLAGPGIHQVTYTVGSGFCQGDDSKLIEVFPLPELIMPPDQCNNADPIQYVDINSNPGIWNISGNGGNGSAFYPAMTTPGTYYFTFIDSLTMCSNVDSLVVIPLTEIDVNDTTFCDTPGLVTLPETDPSGGIWVGAGISGDQFDPDSAGGVGSYEAIYGIVDSNNCPNSDTITINIIPLPQIDAGPVDTFCIDQGPVSLTGYIPVAGGEWSGSGIVDSTGIFDPAVAGGGTHTLSFVTGLGNCQVSDFKTVFVVDLSFVNAGPDLEACVTDTTFNLPLGSPSGGWWTGPGIVDPLTGAFDPGSAGVGDHYLVYFWTESFSQCVGTDTLEMVVHPLPIPVFDGPGIICVGDTAFFNNSSVDSTSVFWEFGDGGTSTAVQGVHIYSAPGIYTISLTVENAYGCIDSALQSIFVTEPPVADFVLDTTEGCFTTPITYTNLSSGYQPSYFWDLGNGETFDGQTPPPGIYQDGINDTTYVVTLEVTNLCGTTSHLDTVLIHTQPVIEFSPNIDDGCSPLTVEFAHLSTGTATDFYWDFGNGQTSTDSLPGPVTYESDTTAIFTTTLIISNVCAADTATHDFTVYPPAVEAFFFADTTSGCPPLTVNFANFSAFENSVVWDFGDGTGSTEENPTHVFTESGQYIVTQYATNNCGTDSMLIPINILPPPVPGFTANASVCQGNEITFTNTTMGLVNSVWDFGDGISEIAQNPVHIYENPGVYTVTLTVTGIASGCSATVSQEIEVLDNPLAQFDISGMEGCAPLIVQFSNQSVNGTFHTWDFGDNNTSVEEHPEHTYIEPGTYTVTLVTSDINGCFHDTSLADIVVFPVPDSEFDFGTNDLCGLPVTFDFTNLSTDAEGYDWHFGNGTSSTLINPSATYDEEGDYTVTLISSNQFGCVDTSQQVLRTFEQPLADFDIGDHVGCAPLEVNFENLSVYADAAYWDFGDGNFSNELNPTHTYTEPGIYHVELIAFYQGVCADTIRVFNVVEVQPTPIAQFDYTEESGGILQFVDLSENAVSWFWDFGDGETSTEQSPQHRYFQNGTHVVTLIVEGFNGCPDTAQVTIEPQLIYGLFIPNAFSPEIGAGDVRLFKPKGVGLTEYRIDVYSTYGKLLWSSTALDGGQPAEAWDGTYNGKLLPQDVYVWKAYGVFEDGSNWRGTPDVDGNLHRVGSVTLLR